MKKFALFTGSLMAGISVALGAFGAHAWKDYLRGINRLETFETAARYQMYGGITLLILGIWQMNFSNKHLKSAAYFQFAGCIIFPGSLYLICLTNMSIFGAIAPIGGLSHLLGYGLMMWSIFKK
jgi:uncharacterized membrane protein YgdD (TMEM256/DUF423 family)